MHQYQYSNLLPQKGDSVLLGYLSNRALAIAPNYPTFKAIKTKYPKIAWLHPDLFLAELSKTKHPAPTKEDFKNFCNKYALSTIFIALKNELRKVDCYSFATLQKEPFKQKAQRIKLPFYNRIGEPESSLFNFFKDEMKNYYSYYQNLLEQK